jgi:hypothetical protein
MRTALSIIVSLLSSAAFAAQPPLEIDPNTRIQGGADVRGSGAAAGAGMRRDDKMDTGPRVGSPANNIERPENSESDKDQPISERKPTERQERSKDQPVQQH